MAFSNKEFKYITVKIETSKECFCDWEKIINLHRGGGELKQKDKFKSPKE